MRRGGSSLRRAAPIRDWACPLAAPSLAGTAPASLLRRRPPRPLRPKGPAPAPRPATRPCAAPRPPSAAAPSSRRGGAGPLQRGREADSAACCTGAARSPAAPGAEAAMSRRMVAGRAAARRTGTATPWAGAPAAGTCRRSPKRAPWTPSASGCRRAPPPAARVSWAAPRAAGRTPATGPGLPRGTRAAARPARAAAATPATGAGAATQGGRRAPAAPARGRARPRPRGRRPSPAAG
mmetsp:Transcript_78373/g.205680  ORF Transcript_78373/g.205680 Transcript_78373/m.205680 type:complete len:237 (+) Transcript_78373:779-1489(+)